MVQSGSVGHLLVVWQGGERVSRGRPGRWGVVVVALVAAACDPAAPLVEMPQSTPAKICGSVPYADCFTLVPGGVFRMGSQSTDPQGENYDGSARADESPVHEVTVAPFWIMQSEATVIAYRNCVAAGECLEDVVLQTGGYSTYQAEGADYFPITSVTWAAAQAHCQYLGGRLPTEAEWEFAARGAQGTRYSGVDALPCDETGEGVCHNAGPTSTLGSAIRPPFGLSWMTGNVWEWTGDRYDRGYYARSESMDPAGPEAGSKRVIRGGGWTWMSAEDLRASRRAAMDPLVQVSDLGYRCVVP